MDFSIFKQPDPSGRMFKESYLLKNYPDHYTFIIEGYTHLQCSFKEKVYLSINGLTEIPKCVNPECVNNVRFKNSNIGYLKYCSNKCISKDPSIIQNKKINSINKWGVEHPSQLDSIKEKIIKTNIERYGGNSPMSNNKIKEKSKETLLENWSVDNPSKSKILLDKRIDSFKNSDFKDSFKKSSIEKYGVEHPWMNKEIHKKTTEHFYIEYRKRIEERVNGNYTFNRFEKDLTTTLIFDCGECKQEFNILPYQFYWRVNNGHNPCTKCFPISDNSSLSQIEIYHFVSGNTDLEVLQNKRIGKYEIDIYLPELNIGFEYNGLWWHSDKYKEENYHLNKTKYFKEMGISIITIWEDEWIMKMNICKSFILNKIGGTPSKIGARKCSIKLVSWKDSKKFLDDNHLQGDCKSSIRLGLYFNEEIVSFMSFSKGRVIMNGDKDSYELTRFCNKLFVNVVGGASKLLKYFIDNYSPSKIVTYSDNLISSGELHEKLGFNFIHESKPGYWYLIDGKGEHRSNWTKKKLIKLGFDPSLTEEQMMNEIGAVKIMNGGNKRWEF
jgi:hypothetical protein